MTKSSLSVFATETTDKENHHALLDQPIADKMRHAFAEIDPKPNVKSDIKIESNLDSDTSNSDFQLKKSNEKPARSNEEWSDEESYDSGEEWSDEESYNSGDTENIPKHSTPKKKRSEFNMVLLFIVLHF